jgi:NhaP-type Na+/H+ and K+/H+ antiporter
MNKRIQELAEEAWIADCIEHNPKYKKSETTELVMRDHEGFHKKFADLIINECIVALIAHGKTYEHQSAGEYQSKQFSNAIKQYFGDNKMNEDFENKVDELIRHVQQTTLRPTRSDQYREWTLKIVELTVKECLRVGNEAFFRDHSTVPCFPTKQIEQHFGLK